MHEFEIKYITNYPNIRKNKRLFNKILNLIDYVDPEAIKYYKAMIDYPIMTGFNLMNPFSGYWTNLLERVKIKTPIESMNIIINGWSMYQTISSRLLNSSSVKKICPVSPSYLGDLVVYD